MVTTQTRVIQRFLPETRIVLAEVAFGQDYPGHGEMVDVSDNIRLIRAVLPAGVVNGHAFEVDPFGFVRGAFRVKVYDGALNPIQAGTDLSGLTATFVVLGK